MHPSPYTHTFCIFLSGKKTNNTTQFWLNICTHWWIHVYKLISSIALDHSSPDFISVFSNSNIKLPTSFVPINALQREYWRREPYFHSLCSIAQVYALNNEFWLCNYFPLLKTEQHFIPHNRRAKFFSIHHYINRTLIKLVEFTQNFL